MKKLKILCLHGYGTNGDFLKKQCSGMIKLLQPYAELYFPDGPFEAPHNFVIDEKVLQLIKGNTLSWYGSISSKMDVEQFYKSLEKVRETFQKLSDNFDGILGFSQGAMLTHLLLRSTNQAKIKWKVLEKVKFCIIISGRHYKILGIDNSKPIKIPSLHIISPQDFIFHNSLLATTQFINPIILRHHYGHRIPKFNINQKSTLIRFIKSQRDPQIQLQYINQSKL